MSNICYNIYLYCYLSFFTSNHLYWYTFHYPIYYFIFMIMQSQVKYWWFIHLFISEILYIFWIISHYFLPLGTDFFFIDPNASAIRNLTKLHLETFSRNYWALESTISLIISIIIVVISSIFVIKQKEHFKALIPFLIAVWLFIITWKLFH
jgi:heme/copper-type cytochrome/quinol oxidase subunit 4